MEPIDVASKYEFINKEHSILIAEFEKLKNKYLTVSDSLREEKYKNYSHETEEKIKMREVISKKEK